MSDSVLGEKNCLVSIFCDECNQIHTDIRDIFKKTETGPSDIWRDGDLHGIILHLRLRNFQGKESTWLIWGNLRNTKRGSQAANWGLYHYACIQKTDASCYCCGSDTEEGYTFQGFSGRNSLPWYLLNIVIISLPSALTGKLNKYTCNVLPINLLGLIQSGLPTHH